MNTSSARHSFWLVIPAAGSGKRMDTPIPKQYQLLASVPMLQRTLDIFLPLPQLQGVVVALLADDKLFAHLPAAKHPLVKTVIGGSERADSVRQALDYLAQKADRDDWVLVHDAARPLVQAQDVMAMFDALSSSSHGGIMAIPVSDTVKQVKDTTIVATQDREQLWQAQTPQMFRLGALLSALQQAKTQGHAVTDEASAMEMSGVQPQVFTGKRSNMKLTVPEDWQLAEALLASSRGNAMTMPRVGHGYDVHRFDDPSPAAFVTLGGVRIPHHKKLIAHSDGDVLIHALCDALLGAAALGDIGKHFPDTDNRYQNIDSRVLLRKVVALLNEKKFAIVNVDVTVVAQAPKLLPHVGAMCANLASDLGIAIDQVNVKATTTEKLGFEGREEGISCHAVAIIFSV